MIDLYHRTTWAAARRIAREGFRDESGIHPATRCWTGVWLSDRAPIRARGIRGRALLVVALDLSATDVANHEIVAVDQPGHVFVLPAAVVNARGRVRLIDRIGIAARALRRC